jgi:hypothetical protein
MVDAELLFLKFPFKTELIRMLSTKVDQCHPNALASLLIVLKLLNSNLVLFNSSQETKFEGRRMLLPVLTFLMRVLNKVKLLSNADHQS